MIRFYNLNNIVQVSYYVNGVRKRKSTGVRVQGWNQKKQQAIGEGSDYANDRLQEIKYELSGGTTIKKIMFLDVSEEFSNQKYSLFGERLAKRTSIGRQTVHNHLARFEEETKCSLDIGYCNKYNEIERNIKINLCSSYAQELKEFFQDKSKSTLSQYMKYVCSVFNYAKKKYDIEIDHDSFKVKQPSYGVDVLSVEDFKTFVDVSFDNYKDKGALVCLLTAFTGARISEILSWTYSNNIVDGSLVYLPLKNKKYQKDSITIPLESKLLDVLKYHQEQNTNNDYILYGYSYENARLLFKAFIETLDFMSKSKSKIRLDAQDNVVQESKQLKDIITIHKIRGSFISNMAMMGVSHETIKYFSGHKQDSRSFARYVGVDKEHAKNSYNNFTKNISISSKITTLSSNGKEGDTFSEELEGVSRR